MAASLLGLIHSNLVQLPHERSDFVLEGVFVHPDHLQCGFSDDLSTSWSSSGSSSLLSYDTAEDDEEESLPMHEMRGLALSCSASSQVQEEMKDYFAPRPGSSSSPFYSDSTSSSLLSSQGSVKSGTSFVSTTPTCELAGELPPFARRPSYGDIYPNLSAPSASFPASFSFNTFAPSTSRPSSRPPSPRAYPYGRSTGGAAMARSVSSPVETQRQLEERQNTMMAATAAMDERTAKMVRSKSVAAALPTVGGVAMSRSKAVSRSPTAIVSPLLTPFGEGWGAALPPRTPKSPAMLPYPYNLAAPARSPCRVVRANSYGGIENQLSPLVEHRNSLPTTHTPGSPAPSSPSVSRPSRRQRLTPLTAIVSPSPESRDDVHSSLDSFTFSPSPSSPPSMVRGRLHRGMTF
ncbi:hypothetical protein JCM1840_001678 [Sporobolomyces johnsonii]